MMDFPGIFGICTVLRLLFTFLLLIRHQLVVNALPTMTPTEDFTHYLPLDSENKYVLFWKYDDLSITFEVHVETLGYVGFGISTNGAMSNSDVVVGWIKSGEPHLQDRYASQRTEPDLDAQQDYVLLDAAETGTHTMLKFRRLLKTCDTQDIDITRNSCPLLPPQRSMLFEFQNGTVRLIWAYHPSDPVSPQSGLPFHGTSRRGSRSVLLLSPTFKRKAGLPEDALAIDFLNQNVTVPARRTTYWCTAFKLPNFDSKKHVIQYEPVIQPGHEGLVHHILVYTCPFPVSEALHTFNHECYHPNMPDSLKFCNGVTFAWGVGGGPFHLPDHVGFPLGGPEDPKFMMIETHYDNPESVAGLVDASGLRLWVTNRLRQYDAGILETGVMVDSMLHIIPPGVSSFTSYGFCVRECLEQAMLNQSDALHIFAAGIHTHLTGSAVHVRHFREDKELPIIAEDDFYDFNFQQARLLQPEATILPGDFLVTQCKYKTIDRIKPVVGGFSTRDEMCLGYLAYYPRINLTSCLSVPTAQQLVKAVGGEVGITNKYPYFRIKAPPSFKGMTLPEAVGRINWTDPMVRDRYQSIVSSGKVTVRCEKTWRYQYAVAGSP